MLIRFHLHLIKYQLWSLNLLKSLKLSSLRKITVALEYLMNLLLKLLKYFGVLLLESNCSKPSFMFKILLF